MMYYFDIFIFLTNDEKKTKGLNHWHVWTCWKSTIPTVLES